MADNWGGIVSIALAGASGLVENLFGKSMEEQAREKEAALGAAPKFEVPKSQLEYERLMATKSRQEMPGASRMQENIEAAPSGARMAGTQVGGLGASNMAADKRKRFLRQLGIGKQQYRSQAELDNIGAVASRTPYEVMQHDYEWRDWQIAKNEIATLRGAGQNEIMSGLDRGAAAGIYTSSMFNGQQGQQPQQSPYQPYNYGMAGQQMNQMGQQQVYPSSNMGAHPYPNTGVPQTGYTEPWMTKPF